MCKFYYIKKTEKIKLNFYNLSKNANSICKSFEFDFTKITSDSPTAAKLVFNYYFKSFFIGKKRLQAC